MDKNIFFILFRFLCKHISFGFAATFFLSPPAITLSLYTYYFVARTGSLAYDESKLNLTTLIVTLAAFTLFHVIYAGLLKKIGFAGISKSLRTMNTLYERGISHKFMNLCAKELSNFYDSIVFFPKESFFLSFLNGVCIMIITSIHYFSISSSSKAFPFIFMGGIFAALIYGFFTFNIIEYFIGPTKGDVEEILYTRVADFKPRHLMSYKTKSFFTEIFIVFDMVIIVILLNINKTITIETIIFIFISVFGLSFLVFLLNNSITTSLKRINISTKDLANGGSGLFFSTYLDYELVNFSNNYNLAANEVNKLRNDLERSIDDSTKELNEAYDQLSDLYQQIISDLNVSRKIQTRVLPRNLNNIEGINVHIHYDPMTKIGGDIYDVIELSQGYIRVLLADAMGNGVQAALVAMIIKTEYEKLKQTKKPSSLLKLINKSFFESYGILNVFFSIIIIDIDLKKNELIYASAGHPDQILLRNNDVIILKHTGKLAGIMPDSQYTENRYTFTSFDRIVLFTDGLFEQYNKENENFGRESVKKIITRNKEKSVKVVVEGIINDLQNFLGEDRRISIYDDVTIIGIERE